MSNKYAAYNFRTLHVCCGKCEFNYRLTSSANPQASEIDRKPIQVHNMEQQKYSYLVVGMQLGWAFSHAVFKLQLHRGLAKTGYPMRQLRIRTLVSTGAYYKRRYGYS